jgi:hypothetical protein
MQEWMGRSRSVRENKSKPLRSRDFLAGDRELMADHLVNPLRGWRTFALFGWVGAWL